MFAQIITMKVPPGNINKLRMLLTEEYLPDLSERAGFISAHFMEQVDDRHMAQLVVHWETQAHVEEASQTSALAGSTHSIAARIPGMRVQRTSYIVTAASEEAITM